jgi:SOS-response transcriptional repressor LexA
MSREINRETKMKETVFSLGGRIRQVRQSRSLTQKDFAESLGIAQGFLSSIERDRKPPSATLLIAMTHLYQVDAQWLSSGEGGPGVGTLSAMSQTTEPSASKTPLLRRVASDFPQRLEAADLLGYISVPDSPPGCYALVAYGDFMAPTIQDNDLVLFRMGGEINNGDIALVKNNWGDTILRRYRLKEDGEWFVPDNNAYKPFQLPRSHAIAVVTNIWRRMKL